MPYLAPPFIPTTVAVGVTKHVGVQVFMLVVMFVLVAMSTLMSDPVPSGIATAILDICGLL